MLTRINGVHIDLSHPDLQYKTLKELRASENVFDHIPADQRVVSQKMLWDALGGKESDEIVIEPAMNDQTMAENDQEIKEG